MYIALEGVKGTGKSTLFALLGQELEKTQHNFAYFCPTKPMPASSWWEQSYALWQKDDEFLSALYAARANYHAQQIEFANSWVLGDRSILTSLVTRWDETRAQAYAAQIMRQEYAVPCPDVVLYLDAPIGMIKQRLNQRKRDYGQQDETIQRLQQAKKAYQHLFEHRSHYPALQAMQVYYLDASQNREQVLAQALSYIRQL